ncbi:hypothetical protein KUTeg_024017 [Tegillarca granosa]|uniref:DH domain-containing protein n=1 Tax=Tegillarca granosa TaxID=220873 RepID=A0ABQ9DW41_TEGGR|nr:hypothetical protein KUTeg_024017 [Tegillarca granosa]
MPILCHLFILLFEHNFYTNMESVNTEESEEKGVPEESDDEVTVMKPIPFSPKVQRPKLPEFTGHTKSGHHRAKTDPGRGEEIKAIIDKTMEDIKELNRVDFGVYSRPKFFPKPLSKSQSTHASPRASPTHPCPSTADDILLHRNRSRSLKILTDMLKSGKHASDYQSDNIAKSETDYNNAKSISDSQLLPTKRSTSMGNDGERRSSSEGQLGVKKGEGKTVCSSTSGVSTLSGGESTVKMPEQATTEERDINVESGDQNLMKKIKEQSRLFRRAKSEVRKPNVSDDEGLGAEDTETLSASHKPFHLNSQFIMLSKTLPPKRRTGFSGLKSPFAASQGDDGIKYDEPSRRKLHKIELKPLSGSGRKTSATRYTTHPSESPKSTFHEEGALDTNGFGALSKMPSTEGSPGPGDLDLGKSSELSLADSVYSHGESIGESSYQDVGESAMDEPETDFQNVDKKNGKSVNLKSKSDPTKGEGTGENVDLPQVISSEYCASQLSKDSEYDSAEDIKVVEGNAIQAVDLDISGDSPRVMRDDSFDDNRLLKFELDRGSIDLASETEDNSSVCSPETTQDRTSEAGDYVATPSDQSPTTIPEPPPHFLNVPQQIKKQAIARSASSASVLQRERKFSGGKDKDAFRKHSITSGDDTNSPTKYELFPLGDGAGVQATSMPLVWKNERGKSESPERDSSFVKDKRYHIVEELYRNEKDYVEALKTLKDKYMVPLKISSSIDETTVDNIFYMIPEILTHHSIYLDFLDNVWKHWDKQTSTIGNILVTIFSKQTVVDSYLSFLENYRTSGKVIESTKSSVQKIIEQCHKESGSKLSMKDLIVRPIQRIPRYELLIQRLLDNTPTDHPDYKLLKEAERVMHDFAIKLGTVNETQNEEDQQESLRKLELLLLTDLAVPDRQYLRHDYVSILGKKDQCCIWMFSDLIIISSLKRRTGPVTRKVSIILKSSTGQDFAENIKHKVWLRVGLGDLEIVKTQVTSPTISPVDAEQLEEDLNILNEINDMTSKLTHDHSGLDEALKEIMSSLNKQLAEYTEMTSSLDSSKMEILVTTQEGVHHLDISFNSSEKRSNWESAFTEAKQRLALLSDRRAPEFLQPLQITKTRAGMQFSCASPIDGVNSNGYRDVWVCNSDGYVGHMCLLSLQPEPIVTLNTPVPGCNARILCISAVPAHDTVFRRKTSGKKSHKSSQVLAVSEESPQIFIEEVDSSSSSEDEEEEKSEVEEKQETLGIKEGTPDGYQSDEETTTSEEEDTEEEQEKENSSIQLVKDFLEGIEVKRTPVSSFTQSCSDSITMSGNWTQDSHKSTMWLGTEDGCIHIFQCTDNIKTTKNKLKIHHGSPVYCIVYLDNKVFVSLANGDLIVYKRDADGMWDTEHPYIRAVGSVTSPITKMLAVAGKLWCGCQNTMNVINPLTLRIETKFQVTSDTNRSVQCLVCSGQGVWMATQQSSKVLLYHATTYEFLTDVSIAQAVGAKLQSADDIIRQHKAACLRITSLLVCKDLLWIGTSAGVILTLTMPRITTTSTSGSITSPSVTGLVYGHTGHVRFLTSVELINSPSTPTNKTDQNSDTEEQTGNLAIHDIHRRSSMAATTATMATRMLVISGGDGYEDFRNNVANEAAGRDDSTNHLLLWQV